ncbi:MAG: trigger factor [Candidatus Limnocylindrales bacterium]
MKVTTTPAPRSTMLMEVELPADRLQRSIDESVRQLARRTRVPGFRPGKIPRPLLERALGVSREPGGPNPIYDDAKEHLFEGTVVQAIQEADADVLSIPAPEWVSFEEGSGARYRLTLPLRPEVRLGAYTDYPFGIEIEEIDEAKIDSVIEQLRDQNATLVPVEDRPAHKTDYAVISFRGTRDGQEFEGGSAERFPLVIGADRMIPGFEDQLVGLREGESKTFSLTFPDDYPDTSLAGSDAQFHVTMREIRAKQLPDVDDDFAASLGTYENLAALREEVGRRLRANALDRARHAFSDRIIEFATDNATVELPEVLVDREVEVMHDELRARLGEQGIGYEEYLKVRFAQSEQKPETERIIIPGRENRGFDPQQAEDALHAEYRQPAEHRVKVLLVIGAIADAEGIEIDDAAVDGEIERARTRYAENPKLIAYFESARGRAYVRSTLRRTRTVETLVDRWLEAHPEVGPVPHLEDDPALTLSAAPANDGKVAGDDATSQIQASQSTGETVTATTQRG